MKKIEIFLKDVFDKLFSLILLIILLPIFVIISILIKLDSKGPVFFIQERVGKDGKTFKLIKFRTMIVGAEEKTKGTYIDEKNPYITKVGKFLRRWSLDELPELINVLKGEMSLVGPRPTLKYQVEKYNEFQKKRLLVKPGITGWAQVNGRNRISWEERIKLDIWYIENWSLILDLKILFKTVFEIFKKENVFGKVEEDKIVKNE